MPFEINLIAVETKKQSVKYMYRIIERQDDEQGASRPTITSSGDGSLQSAALRHRTQSKFVQKYFN
jgi:hypothetical protein